MENVRGRCLNTINVAPPLADFHVVALKTDVRRNSKYLWFVTFDMREIRDVYSENNHFPGTACTCMEFDWLKFSSNFQKIAFSNNYKI